MVTETGLSVDHPLRLESERFSIIGKLTRTSNGQRWYEFDVESDGKKYSEIGGQAEDYFVSTMFEILSKKSGKKLSTLKHAPYKSYVGGDDAEYMGHVVFSGHTTLYFFKLGMRISHVVMADSEGKMLTHTALGIDVADAWLKQLVEKVEEGSHEKPGSERISR